MSEGDSLRRLVTADEASEVATVNRIARIQGRYAGETPAEYVTRGPETIRKHVEALVEATAGSDAFDVIELVRRRELPMALEGYRESLADQLPVAVRIISSILIARGFRRPEVGSGKGLADVVEDLHERADELSTIGMYTLLDAGSKQQYGPCTMLSALYVSHGVNVQSRQHAHIQDDINEALFASAHLGDVLMDAVGFTYEDFVAVRDAIGAVQTEKFNQPHEIFLELYAAYEAGMSADSVRERFAAVREAIDTLPGTQVSFTAAEVTQAAAVDTERVQRILDLFSVTFGAPSDPVVAVQGVLAGNSPVGRAGLIHDEHGNYISIGAPIGTDCFRQVVEAALVGTKSFKRYEKRRVAVSEGYALEHLGRMLGTTAQYAGLKYFRANADVPVSELGRDATGITKLAEQTEADGLFLIEDVAICVEVKGKSISQQARGGQVRRLSADVEAVITDATTQALRLEGHIRVNGGLWLEDRSWLDLSFVREIRSVAVALDDLGPLSTGFDELVRAGVITSERFPWIVTLHDLMVVAEVIERPTELLLYLRRRTESGVSLNSASFDELDHFMLFLSGGLSMDPDPDRIREEFSGAPGQRAMGRRQDGEGTVSTQVLTHTDPLDAWVYFTHGLSTEPAPKPTFQSSERIDRLVNFLAEGRKPGWFRFGADLLNPAPEVKEAVADTIEEVAAHARSHSEPQVAVVPLPDSWGHPILFVGSKPTAMRVSDASTRLGQFAAGKKQELRSDRTLMVLVDEYERILAVRYDNLDPAESAGALPVESEGRPIPPSARRATKRLNPKKRPRRKR